MAKKEEFTHRVNHRIRAKEIRVVGENIESGIYTRDEALRMAQGQGLDLVEISPNASPPVCRIVDYSKFKFEQKKRQKELKAKQAKTVLKEIRFGPNTDSHDFEFKKKHAMKFLEEGNKVKAYVHFFGRTIVYKERGANLLEQFAQELEAYGKPEQPIRMEGRRMILTMVPNKGKE